MVNCPDSREDTVTNTYQDVSYSPEIETHMDVQLQEMGILYGVPIIWLFQYIECVYE